MSKNRLVLRTNSTANTRTRGEGVQKSENFADVLNGSSLTVSPKDELGIGLSIPYHDSQPAANLRGVLPHGEQRGPRQGPAAVVQHARRQHGHELAAVRGGQIRQAHSQIIHHDVETNWFILSFYEMTR